MTRRIAATALAAVALLGGATADRAAEPDLHFEPQGLYGHINGGAELFLEFGFAGLDVFHHAASGERAGDPGEAVLDVEVYRMDDPAAALGIYLAKCGDERAWLEVPARNTGSAYQLTAVRGSLFVQINNFAGDADARPAMAELARAYLAPEPEAEPLAIWDDLPTDGLVPGSEFLARGRFALEPIYTLGAGDVLRLETDGALAAGARYDVGGATVKRLVVRYPDAASAAAAMSHLQENLDSYLTTVHADERALVFRDWQDRYGHVRRDGARLRIGLQLVERPTAPR
ncbi:hypothetical protein GF314_13440 [bacterium]|nr:hypothetical protein [bacterium]